MKMGYRVILAGMIWCSISESSVLRMRVGIEWPPKPNQPDPLRQLAKEVHALREEPEVLVSSERGWVRIGVPLDAAHVRNLQCVRVDDSVVLMLQESDSAFMLQVSDDVAYAKFSTRTHRRESSGEGSFESTYSGNFTVSRPYILPENVVIDERVQAGYENNEYVIRLPTR